VTLTADAASGGHADKSLRLLLDLDARGTLPALNDAQPDDDALAEVISRLPEHAMALNNLGYVRLEAGVPFGDRAQIERWIESAYLLEPDDANILDTLGWLRYKQGRFAGEAPGDDSSRGAVSLIQQAIEASDDPSAEVYDHLGDALYRTGDPEAATRAWRRARAILQDDDERQQTIEQFGLLQTRLWNLVVRDPEELWERDYGTILNRVRDKLAAVESERAPKLAPTFDELE
ncbi:MAG: hypothetical protein ACYTGC_02360, partial [Planctomycetota bacterium]|jgi:tetratricopeptide (TPR) repeat protein